MKPLGLGEERVPDGEAGMIEEIKKIHLQVQEEVDRKFKPVPRGQHPKHHGCVRAEFLVEPDLSAEYRHGVFAAPSTFQALIRFSNGGGRDDTKADIHGMAIKLLGVSGEKLLEGEKDAETQDFIMVDSSEFFVRNMEDYVPFMGDFRRLKSPGLNLGFIWTIGKVLLSPNYKFRMLRASRKQMTSPLATRYWSTTPYKLGEGQAMKFSARPDPSIPIAPAPDDRSKDRYRKAMSAHLKDKEARFDFLVQRQTDAEAMPIEDPTVPWSEARSPYVKVATIRIPPQAFESQAQMDFCENLSFTPWHSIEDHRPLGGVNRARKVVYEAISRGRHALNGVPKVEPKGLAEVAS